jgi:Tfp pilus assembly protein PilF
MIRYNEAKSIREAALGPHHPSVGDSHVNIGNVFLRKCAFSEARREFEAALLNYKRSNLPSDDPKVARTMAVIERVKRDEELCV